jgi:hemolysin activation/secretion protein
VILPGSEYGTSTITIVADEDRSQSTIRLNNYGRVSLGEARLEGGWLFANPFFQGDQLNLSAIVAEDARMLFGRVDYDALINKSGTRVGIGASAFTYDVDTAELGLKGELGGDGANLRLLLTHPLVRRQRNRLDFIAVYRRDETTENGNLALSTATQSIKVLDLTLQWQPTHANGAVSSAFFTFSSNFENNSDGSKDDALKDKFTIDYSYHTLFAKTWFALLRANLVYASDPLPDVERYRLGGPNSVRAYPSAEAAGDKGELFSVDIGKRFRLSGTTLLIAKIFADTGKVTRFFPAIGSQREEKLAGYGAGILVDFAGRHTIEFEVVTPTTDRVSSDGRDTRGWFNYAAHF